MDDARLLNYFLHAYDYVMAEKGWQLWRRRDDAPPAEAAAPRRLRSPQLRVGEALDLADLADRPLWVTIDLRPTLLGRARDLLYKSPILRLVVTDSAGKTTRFRLPPDQGRTGFMLSPLVENENDLIQFAGGTPARRVAKFALEVDGGPGPFFHDTAAVGLFALPPSEAGRRALAVMERAKYSVFGSMPLSVDAFAPPNRIKIDGVETIMLHAPAALEFAVPPGATIMVGRIGFAPNAYTGDNRTGGAEYRIVWTDRTTEHVLYRRYLDPRNNPDDRGLVSFEANVAQVPTGRVRLVIAPGADNGWDWTACTGIEFR